jgi:hypothetical protein
MDEDGIEWGHEYDRFLAHPDLWSASIPGTGMSA